MENIVRTPRAVQLKKKTLRFFCKCMNNGMSTYKFICVRNQKKYFFVPTPYTLLDKRQHENFYIITFVLISC